MSIGGYNVFTDAEHAEFAAIADKAFAMMGQNAVKNAQRNVIDELGVSSPSDPAVPVLGAMRGDIPLSWNDKEIK